MAVIPVSLHNIAMVTQIAQPHIMTHVCNKFFACIAWLYNKTDNQVNKVHNNSARPTIPDT